MLWTSPGFACALRHVKMFDVAVAIQDATFYHDAATILRSPASLLETNICTQDETLSVKQNNKMLLIIKLMSST